MKRSKTLCDCVKFLLLGVQGGGVSWKVDLKVAMTSVSFPTDSSSDILEFICCGTFSWSLDSALWSPHGYISLTVWTETAGKQLECGRGNRTFVCFDTSHSLESASFFLKMGQLIWLCRAVAVSYWSLLGFLLTLWPVWRYQQP